MPGQKASEVERRGQILRAAYGVASRAGLESVTVRLVAAEAGVSSGLVLFHFKSKDQLVVALLEYVLATTTVLHITEEIAAVRDPLDRLLLLLQREMNRLASEPRRIRLFFEFWIQGFQHPEISARMQTELDRYRQAFRPMAEEVLEAERERFAHVTPEGLAAVAVSFIKGCAVQSMLDPQHFDMAEFLAAAQGLLGQLGTRAI
ncbi:MAG: TetR/AcrR family transcriptional regulator [Gemmatimonadaceae bacterium]|nr:TetR/AcrR family transcriptional regulator [Gemmatimonadaceae bacterium]